MDTFEEKLDELEDLIEQERYDEAQSLISNISKSSLHPQNVDDLVEFLRSAADAIEDIESSQLFSYVTDWAVNFYRSMDSRDNSGQLKVAVALADWLNNKIEFLESPGASKEGKLSLVLFEDIIRNDQVREDAVLSSEYQGYATYSLLVGLHEKRSTLVDQAIEYQRKVLHLYKNGSFPNYYNLDTFVAGATRDLASVMIKSCKLDKRYCKKYKDEIRALLQSAKSKFRSCGTDFDRDFTNTLIQEFENELG